MINILKLIDEIKSYNEKDKQKILHVRIEERLNKSLKEYYNQLTENLDKLYLYNENHENLNLIKKINKEIL